MKRFTVLSEFTVSVALALVLAFALAGCRSGNTEEDSFENGLNKPGNGVVPPALKYEYDGPFVKADANANAKDSVINLIKAAADGSLDDYSLPEGVTYKQGALVFNLKEAAAETVSFDDVFRELALTHTGNTDTDTSPAIVTIDGGKRVIDLTGKTGGPLITVGQGVTLTLKNITFKGLSTSDSDNDNDSANNTHALILVSQGGHLVLQDGAVISDNTGTGGGNVDSNDWGGGVRVDGGTFTMEDGEVRGNKAEQAAGVYIINGGKFKMTGGAISGNEANGGGGGVRIKNGTFEMEDGAISGNTGDYSGGGVEVESGGTFTMTGGKISGNMSLGTLGYEGGRGGGLFVSGGQAQATMKGNAVIENNEVKGIAGGAGVVIQENGKFTMGENAVIRNNEADGGVDSGGVGVWTKGAFFMEGGTISGNKVTGVGGGVYVNEGGGMFSKTGGIIYGNNAETSLQNTASGGGHAVAVGGSPTKKRNNTADVDLHWPLKSDGTDNNWD